MCFFRPLWPRLTSHVSLLYLLGAVVVELKKKHIHTTHTHTYKEAKTLLVLSASSSPPPSIQLYSCLRVFFNTVLTSPSGGVTATATAGGKGRSQERKEVGSRLFSGRGRARRGGDSRLRPRNRSHFTFCHETKVPSGNKKQQQRHKQTNPSCVPRVRHFLRVSSDGLFSTCFFRPTSAGGRACEPSGVRHVCVRARMPVCACTVVKTFWSDHAEDEARKTIWIQITEVLESFFAFCFERKE